MFYVTKCFTFDAAHYLENYEGKCANMHGHTYKVEVTLKGERVDNRGILADFSAIKIAADDIIKYYDHKVLNEVEPFTNDKGIKFNPTAENLAMVFYRHFETYVPVLIKNGYIVNGVAVHRVKVWETPDSYAEYKEEDNEKTVHQSTNGG